MIPDIFSLSERPHRLVRRTALTLATFVAVVSIATISASHASGQVAPRRVPAQKLATDTTGFATDSLQIYLMTVGPGDEIWDLFGHNAIWVHDPANPRMVDTVYNWGVFTFDHLVTFVAKFMKGDMQYAMWGFRLDSTLMIYRAQNRHMWVQELNLTTSEKHQLIDFLYWNLRPENYQYKYDYYRDNCSTRVRDAIDRVVGGAVRRKLKSIQTPLTYRDHSLRLMENNILVYPVDLILGRPTDTPLTADQASFLPVQLMNYLQTVKLDDGRSLVGEPIPVGQATRPPESTSIPSYVTRFLVIGVVVAVLLVLVAAGDVASSPIRRRALAWSIAIFAGMLGVLGLVITLLITVTSHVAAHANENAFMLNPLWLVVAIAGVKLIRHGRAAMVARNFAIAGVAVGILAVVFHLVGMSRQPNWDAIGLLLPIELAIAWVMIRASTTMKAPVPA